MREHPTLLLIIAVPLALLLAVAGISIWRSIPPTPDPDAIPSTLLEPPPASYQDTVAEGQSIARALISQEKLPGLSLALAVDGETIWAEGFRWADMENEIPATPSTLFRIGGISEALTSAVVGLLIQRELVDLDAPIQQYLPSFPEKEWPISTRQLMAHAAGLRPHRTEGGIFHGHCSEDAERLALFAENPLIARPGTETIYSTHGWALVGAIVTAVADEPYLDFLQREILVPLGMENTIPEEAGQAETGSAHFYYPRMMLDPRYGLQDSPAVDFSCHLPAVGFLSTPSDLTRFGSAMMVGELLDLETAEQLMTPLTLASDEPARRALGWIVANPPLGSEGRPTWIAGQGLGETVVRKPLSATTAGGQVAGGTATLLLAPEHRIAIAVASNVSGAENVSALALRLAELFVRQVQSR